MNESGFRAANRDTPERLLAQEQARQGRRQERKRIARERQGRAAQGRAGSIRAWRADDASGDPARAGSDVPRKRRARRDAEAAFAES